MQPEVADVALGNACASLPAAMLDELKAIARQYDEAIQAFRHLSTMDHVQHAFVAACHGWLGDHAAAAVHMNKVRALAPEFEIDAFLSTLHYAREADVLHLREGLARELIRTVQDARKQAGLEVSDRIVLGISGSAGVLAALEEHRPYLMAETLAVEWAIGQAKPLFREQRSLEEETWTIEFSKAARA